ncbi:hypothetical protein [Pelagicoccus sp. SDUM812003]|uniref:hypothetical protein n=1 Tax=Pelagicoccus sp. SDUM812003 TaxID=3041267 RepID=UPI00280FF5BF|nr:hypothetical protein [Pelagicoccus sp. SDUM812003]MDQ8205699.1 hypothetical protein [Pelagicoccus sp. SDUM812003]
MELRDDPNNFLTRPLTGEGRRRQSGTPKKPSVPISDALRYYLSSFAREHRLPIEYALLERYQASAPLYDANGDDTLWETLIYEPFIMRQLSTGLKEVYAILKAGGDQSVIEHLYVDRIDYCAFGNSKPFRVRIVNSHNDNQDYFYIKRGDASRIYGLELEHLLSPNRMFFLTDGDTLVEEHVVGLPGDTFIDHWLESRRLKTVRIAKELIKFNERCFVRLLGDMRPYNFVVAITPDFEETQIRIRSMDFDQQSWDGRKNFYLPQFFKENNPLVEFCISHIDAKTAHQYQREEHALIVRRMDAISLRLKALLQSMTTDRIAPREHVLQLRSELADHYKNNAFIRCESMGELVGQSLEHMRQGTMK